jgi:hypothetical protein
VQLLERELAAHGDCEECRELESEYQETAGRMAFALDPMPVGVDQADAILQRATHPATQDVAPGPLSPPDDELEARRARPSRSWATIAAAAAVIVLVVSVVAVLGPFRSTGVHATTNQTIVHFTGTGGELAMAYEPGKPGAVLLGSNFADPGANRVYEIWMIRGTTPESGGCVRPHDGSIVTFVNADLRGVDLMAVTVEDGSCPSQPTTTPFLSAPLTA